MKELFGRRFEDARVSDDALHLGNSRTYTIALYQILSGGGRNKSLTFCYSGALLLGSTLHDIFDDCILHACIHTYIYS